MEEFDGLPPEEEKKNPIFTPLRIIGALFLILILLITVIPYASVKLDPEPVNVPGLEIIPNDILIENSSVAGTRADYIRLLRPEDPVIKRVADRIVAESCDSQKVCQAKAIFYFVRNNFNYVSDPLRYEYIKSARESLVSKAGDCDDASVLLSNLLRSIGIETRFAFVPGHVYVQAYLPDAPSRYKMKDTEWVNIDPTCNNCRFGELAFETGRQRPTYV